MTGPTDLPVVDTVDVREGPEVAHGLLSLLPLLGEWHGEGVLAGRTAGDAAGDRRFGQWVRFAHDGRDFLAYESRTWLIGDDGRVEGPALRESGFFRPRGEDDVELLVASPDGLIELYVGTARTTTSWELTSDVVARTPDAPETTRAVRLYGIVEGALMYAIDRARADTPLRPTMSARLERLR
ncbi:heme-binding beta-barrel domain-containing protein [Geodermatophilus normandii]|uniref:Ferric nitrobindin-like protein n=1 Tax=Geodermatophilus normandii TaxID=1137989 RepID=A0A6P0GNU0_9ACTN|nr:FABP family protein [Geodermatophilus normandii]